jgi:hypothetical protein
LPVTRATLRPAMALLSDGAASADVPTASTKNAASKNENETFAPLARAPSSAMSLVELPGTVRFFRQEGSAKLDTQNGTGVTLADGVWEDTPDALMELVAVSEFTEEGDAEGLIDGVSDALGSKGTDASEKESEAEGDADKKYDDSAEDDMCADCEEDCVATELGAPGVEVDVGVPVGVPVIELPAPDIRVDVGVGVGVPVDETPPGVRDDEAPPAAVKVGVRDDEAPPATVKVGVGVRDNEPTPSVRVSVGVSVREGEAPVEGVRVLDRDGLGVCVRDGVDVSVA